VLEGSAKGTSDDGVVECVGGPGRRIAVKRVMWLVGLTLIAAGCAASPPPMVRSLSLAAGMPASGAATGVDVALQEVLVAGREDRILLTRVSLKNRTPAQLAVGPAQVHLADAGRRLLLRISERWLPGYYDAKLRGLSPAPDREAIPPFPSAELTLGERAYAAPPVTAAQQEALVVEVAKLVEEAFVRPQRDAPGFILDKGSEVTLGVLLKEVTLAPGDGVTGYVYFYHPAGRPLSYPLHLVIAVEGATSAFVFQDR